jgi:hypothetical protein
MGAVSVDLPVIHVSDRADVHVRFGPLKRFFSHFLS